MTTQRIKINLKKAAAEEVALPKKSIKKEKKELYPIITFGQEVDALIAEWYAAQGQEVPADERGLAAVLDKQRDDEWKETLNLAKRAAGEVVLDEEGKPQPPIAAGEKPEFGTPEFWAWARRRRAEENAKRAAEGLPPLPTKKEKEAAKVAKTAAKEAAKAAKAAAKAAKT